MRPRLRRPCDALARNPVRGEDRGLLYGGGNRAEKSWWTRMPLKGCDFRRRFVARSAVFRVRAAFLSARRVCRRALLARIANPVIANALSIKTRSAATSLS